MCTYQNDITLTLMYIFNMRFCGKQKDSTPPQGRLHTLQHSRLLFFLFLFYLSFQFLHVTQILYWLQINNLFVCVGGFILVGPLNRRTQGR